MVWPLASVAEVRWKRTLLRLMILRTLAFQTGTCGGMLKNGLSVGKGGAGGGAGSGLVASRLPRPSLELGVELRAELLLNHAVDVLERASP